MEKDSVIELLIENVKHHKILFDLSEPGYKDIRKKNKVWDSIAENMPIKTTGDELKKKWKNLRDNYAKHLRSETTHTGQAATNITRYKTYKTWPWAEQMEYFRTFLKFSTTESNVSIAVHESQNEEMEENAADESQFGLERSQAPLDATPPLAFSRKRKAVEVPPHKSSVDQVLSYLDKRHSNIKSQYDEIDLTFLGYAASIKKLCNRRQTMIKFQVAKLIMEEELHQQNDESQIIDRPGPSNYDFVDLVE